MISADKLRNMLTVYREKLERVNTPPIDYAEGIRLSAQIGILEDLYYAAVQASQPAPDAEPDGGYVLPEKDKQEIREYIEQNNWGDDKQKGQL